MPCRFAFLPFPMEVLKGRSLDLKNDFLEEPFGAAFGSDGALWVASQLFYNAHRYKDVAANDVSTYFLTRFDLSLASASVILLDRIEKELSSLDTVSSLSGFARTPRGDLIFTTSNGYTWVTDEYGVHRRTYASLNTDDEPATYRDNFVACIDIRPDGRLLAAVSELKSGWDPNIIAVSEDIAPQFSSQGRQPTLRYLTSFETSRGTAPFEIPYVLLPDGSSFIETHRPNQMISNQLTLHFMANLVRLYAVTNDYSVAALFHFGSRNRNTGFAYAVLNASGKVIRTLDLDGDTPYVDSHTHVSVDISNQRIIYKSKDRLHLFDVKGKPLARVPLKKPTLKILAAFHLLGCKYDGSILLLHRKHRTLLLLDPFSDISMIEKQLVDAAAYYKEEYAAAKKTHSPISGRGGVRWLTH